MYNSNKTVTVTLTADEAVAILRNRNSDWAVALHLETAEKAIAAAVRKSLDIHQAAAMHDYAVKHK
jgi:hypothetical protein